MRINKWWWSICRTTPPFQMRGCYLASETYMLFTNHWPYSPDLSPCKYFLPSKLIRKCFLGRQPAFYNWIKRITKLHFDEGGMFFFFFFCFFFFFFFCFCNLNILIERCFSEIHPQKWQNVLQDPRIYLQSLRARSIIISVAMPQKIPSECKQHVLG